MFIDQNYAKKTGLDIQTLEEHLKAFNVDGTENKKGTITYFIDLSFKINNKAFSTCLLVTGLGKQKIILVFPWLQEHNPEIDWKKGKIIWKDITQ